MSMKIIETDGRLVPAKNLPQDVFLEFDRADDDQIIAEIRGGVVEEYVYEFLSGGQKVTGLSLTGVMAVAHQMGGISCGQPVWVSDETEISCDISATDHKTGLTVWGTATEPWLMRTKSGTQRDRYARAKALSKAQRNAIRKLIPEKLAIEMVKMFREQGKVGRVEARQEARVPVQRPRQSPALPPSEPASTAAPAEPQITPDALEKLTQYARERGVAWERVLSKAEEQFDKANEATWTADQGRWLYKWLGRASSDADFAEFEAGFGEEDAHAS